MWVMGGDYYTASDETENFGVWENLISGLESKGANQPIAYHGHFYVSGLWNQGFFDIAAPLTGHCRSPGEAASALNSVKNQVGGRPVYAGEMRYEGFLADFCNGPDQVADEYDIEDDTRVAIDGGMAGIVYGHDQRWDWSPNPIGSLGSAGERRMLRLVEPVAGPDARDDYLTVIEGGSARIAVLNNDERATGVSIDTQPDHGTVTVDGDEIMYEHDGSENHSDEFDYRASGPGGSDRARVSVSVEAQNDAPVAIDDSITVVEGATTSIDLAANDIDPDGPSLSVSIALQPTHGTLELTGTTVVYSHLGGENLEDSFSYQLSDGQAADSAVVDVVIVPSNDLPTLEGPDSLEVIAGSPVTSSFQLSDEDGDQVALQVTAPPEHGTLEIGGATVIYTPDARYVGIDSFSMRAGDGIDYSPEHIVTLNVLERGTGVSLFDPATGSWSMPMRDGSVRSFFFGDPGDQPLLGDWDCDGIDTVGMFRPSNGFVYISNSNAGGFAEQEFFYGIAGDIALVGDWDGNGCDTLAVYRSGRIYLSNFLGTGPAESDFFFGIPGDRPFAGDFDGDGRTGIGLYRQQTGFVYVRNEQSTGVADNEFFYGLASDRIVAGDWDRDGTETVGIFRPSESAMYLSNTNGQGDADVVYQFGTPADVPLAGIVSNPDLTASGSVKLPG